MDTVSSQKRSEIMSRVRGRDTNPEMLVRKAIHRMGFRYRLHVSTLPGKPDLVFPSRKKVIFVHGCFWHRHKKCPNARIPKSRIEFWQEKLEGNSKRDRLNRRKLRGMGWTVLVIWECELAALESMNSRILKFLEGVE
ncbi:MAG: DNA mismatch endonuclease Vsr [Candidatus Hydrogenedentes bacterium]|nr:DNA mismatch endonuclease Vsr [Candidatus Hydrogenedentota bacterium]